MAYIEFRILEVSTATLKHDSTDYQVCTIAESKACASSTFNGGTSTRISGSQFENGSITEGEYLIDSTADVVNSRIQKDVYIGNTIGKNITL